MAFIHDLRDIFKVFKVMTERRNPDVEVLLHYKFSWSVRQWNIEIDGLDYQFVHYDRNKEILTLYDCKNEKRILASDLFRSIPIKRKKIFKPGWIPGPENFYCK
jgi:hypothetical protein